LYRKARAGLLANFTGIDSPYEPPANADIHLMTMGSSPQAQADQLAGWLAERIVP